MKETNILLVGIGGQGVLLASEILAEAVFRQGFDIKKSEVHGMSQRGGGVTSHLRFGDKIHSPLIPVGQADFLMAMHREEGAKYGWMLRPEGRLIGAESTGADEQALGRSLNVYLLGALSGYLTIEPDVWQAALKQCLKPQFLARNLEAFEQGKKAGKPEN